MIPKKDSTKLSFSIWQRLKESNLHHSDSESEILPIKLNLYTLSFMTIIYTIVFYKTIHNLSIINFTYTENI